MLSNQRGRNGVNRKDTLIIFPVSLIWVFSFGLSIMNHVRRVGLMTKKLVRLSRSLVVSTPGGGGLAEGRTGPNYIIS